MRVTALLFRTTDVPQLREILSTLTPAKNLAPSCTDCLNLSDLETSSSIPRMTITTALSAFSLPSLIVSVFPPESISYDSQKRIHNLQDAEVHTHSPKKFDQTSTAQSSRRSPREDLGKHTLQIVPCQAFTQLSKNFDARPWRMRIKSLYAERSRLGHSIDEGEEDFEVDAQSRKKKRHKQQEKKEEER